MPAPEPRVRDEFSYLLAADTFASGRVTNPQHPMWTHLESIHILQTPTYMSMYPPAQGLLLALGQKIAGVPWIGVLLEMSVCCAALCWMLQAWLPPGWAFFGGLLIAMKIGVFTYWMNSYYGGGIAALGGALLFGALPRVMRRANLRDALLLALGLAILANSRPYEGFIAAIPAAGALIWWLLRSRASDASAGSKWLNVALPIVAVMIVTGAWIGYYNWRVTGNALVMPQTLNRQQYAVAPYFMWETLRPDPPYRHEILKKFYTEWESGFQLSDQQDSLEGWLASAKERVWAVWVFYLGTALTLPLLMLPWALRDRRMRFWACAAPVFLIGLVLARFTQAHYVAPMIGGLYVLLMQCFRHLRHAAGEEAGAWMVRAIAIVVVVGFVRNAAMANPGTAAAHPFERAVVEQHLEQMPGPQLVMVRYGENHYLDQEWVYNHADVDHAKVVWAREMSLRSDNVDLQAYFHNRTCWILEPDVDQQKLTPCPPLAAP